MGKRVGMYVGLIGALLGCDGDDDGPGRGTPACRNFQDAICDYAVDRCEQGERERCDDIYGGIECLSDKVADDCSNALNDAECSSTPPAPCYLRTVSNPAPAIANCNRLIDITCERVVGCGQIATLEQCRMEVMAAMVGPSYLNCADALSTSPRFEPCLAELMNIACDAPPPPICRSVIHVASMTIGI